MRHGRRRSELKEEQAGPSYRISGHLTARRLRQHERWLPTASIIVEGADGKGGAFLQLSASHRADGPLDLLLSDPQGEGQTRRLLGHAALGEDIPFELTVERGKATARFGSARAQISAPVGPGASVRISCSTGEFLFRGLRLHTGD